jgi:hypothetical protein
MAEPNQMTASTINMKVMKNRFGTTTITNVLTNTSGSNKDIRIQSITLSNQDATTNSVRLAYRNAYNSSTTTDWYYLYYADIPANGTIVVVDKSSPITLKENTAIAVFGGDAAKNFDVVISYMEQS